MKLLKHKERLDPVDWERMADNGELWSRLWGLKESMDRIFTEYMGVPFGEVSQALREWQSLAPKVDIEERDDRIVVSADVPGVEVKQLTVEVADQSVRLSGHVEHEVREDKGGLVRKEREEGEFLREVSLPASVDPESAEATIHNGLLRIVLRKRQDQQRKRVDIQMV